MTELGTRFKVLFKRFLIPKSLTNFVQVESFLCINTLIRPEEQDKYLKDQKERFTPFITELQNENGSKNSVKKVNLIKFGILTDLIPLY